MVTTIWGRRAVGFVQNGTVGRICKSTPTVCVNFMNEWIACEKTMRQVGSRKLYGAGGWSCADATH